MQHDPIVPLLEAQLPPYTDFPQPTTLWRLADAYFADINMYLPLLHRPSFERDVRAGLHLRDQRFGAVVLLVCANGARYADPHPHGSEPEPGAHWAEQVQAAPWAILARPTVHDLQACAVRRPTRPSRPARG